MHFLGMSTKDAISQNHLAKQDVGHGAARKVSRSRKAVTEFPGPMLVIAAPFTLPPPLHPSPPLPKLQHAHPLISDTHVFWAWGEGVEEGEWECNSRFGRAGQSQRKKIDDSSRRQWEGLLRVETDSIYIPTVCLPGQFWLRVLPYHAGVPLSGVSFSLGIFILSSKTQLRNRLWPPYYSVLPQCAILSLHQFSWIYLHVSFLVDCECLRSKCFGLFAYIFS